MKYNKKAKILVIVFSVLCALAGALIGIFCKNELAAFALIVAAIPPLGLILVAVYFIVMYLEFAGLAITVLLALSPLVYPIVRMIKNKKFYKVFLLWLLDTLVLGAAFFVLFISIDYALLIALMCYWLFILTVLLECNQQLKAGEDKSYSFATVVIYLIIALDVFNTFFGSTFYMVYVLGGALGDVVFAVYRYLLVLGSTVLILIILFRVLHVLAMLKQNMYNLEAVDVLNGVVKLSKATIIYCVISNIITYPVMLFCAALGGSVSAESSFDLTSLLVVCLVIIFINILKRSIAEHEENELTI